VGFLWITCGKIKKDAVVSRVLGSLGIVIQLSVTGNFIPTRQRRLNCKSGAVIIAENVQVHNGRMLAWGGGFVKIWKQAGAAKILLMVVQRST
jgi:hypothetical protein